ncbi:MAG: thymidylate synthase [Nitrospiraceae bacterium]
MNKFHQEYHTLLCELQHGVEETNARTGVAIKMVKGGHSFALDLNSGRLPVAGNRKYYPHIAAAEVAWQFMGTQDPTWITEKAPKIWGAFIESGILETAYGYRWRKHFGRDQLTLAMQELLENPTNRQLYISAWDPSEDGLGGPQPKNVPCPVGFSLTRTGDDLHLSVFIRSSDVFVGLPYDVMGYALTLDAIAASCGLIPSLLHITLAHAHTYEPHFEDLEICLRADWISDEPILPAWSVQEIEKNPDGYVSHVKRLSNRVLWNDWDPKPELVL